MKIEIQQVIENEILSEMAVNRDGFGLLTRLLQNGMRGFIDPALADFEKSWLSDGATRETELWEYVERHFGPV